MVEVFGVNGITLECSKQALYEHMQLQEASYSDRLSCALCTIAGNRPNFVDTLSNTGLKIVHRRKPGSHAVTQIVIASFLWLSKTCLGSAAIVEK